MNVTTQRTNRSLALLGVMSLLAAACSEHAAQEPATTTVTIRAELAQAERTEVPKVVELFGTVEADKTATISTRVMAMVTAVRVQTGDSVRQGQLLLDIDPRAAQGELSQAKGALAQAQAGLALTERNYERFKALKSVDAASELELDMARMQYEQSRGATEQAAGAVAAAASVASDSRVVAPFAGRVTRTMVEVGDLAAPGRPLLMLETEDIQQMALTVPQSVMSAAGLEIGDSLPIRLDSRADLGMLEAAIVEMSPGADPASHSFQIKVALPQEDIPSGASGRAWVEIDRRPAVVIPAAAIMRQGGLVLVVVRLADGRASSRVVTLGNPLPGNRVEVLSGLSGGETVLLGLAVVPPVGARVEAA